MSKKNVFVAAALAVCVLATAGGLLASNMGFKLNYQLTGPASVGGAGTGKQLFSLPYFRQTGIDNAANLLFDIGTGSSGPVSNITKYNNVNDTLIVYNGRMSSSPAVPFTLAGGEGYLVTMNGNVNYIVVGAHDPSLSVALTGPASVGGAGTGKQLFAPPYNITSANAAQMLFDIGGGSSGPVSNITKYNKVNDTLIVYNGRMSSSPAVPFVLAPGEAYLVTMNGNVPYIASHY
jgi:hypothetical protein